MTNEFDDAVNSMQQERGLSRDLIFKTVEEALKAAYKKRYQTDENVVINFSNDSWRMYAQRVIVDDHDFNDPVFEIPLSKALTYNQASEIGDELLIEIDLQQFSRGAVLAAKQRNRQSLREIQKDILYSEYRDKVGELILGYHQRERNGCIFVDLGKAEGILPKRFQSPHERYSPGDRIRALVVDVERKPTGLQIVLSRTDSNLVRRILEVEVSEIYDSIVEIHKIVRLAGYRTKVALFSNRDDVDPVGACIGVKGVRIQAVVRELDGEKIDVVRFDPNPEVFIKNCLAPAQIEQVIVLSYSRKQALAVVEESQLSFAIGKMGMNVRLANRLSEWNIDVKTVEQFNEMEIAQEEAQKVGELFEESFDDTSIGNLDGISDEVEQLLEQNGIENIEDFLAAAEQNFESLTLNEEELEKLTILKRENTKAADNNEEDLEVEYECPECEHLVRLNMTVCPGCGVGLDFGDSEEKEDAEEL